MNNDEFCVVHFYSISSYHYDDDDDAFNTVLKLYAQVVFLFLFLFFFRFASFFRVMYPKQGSTFEPASLQCMHNSTVVVVVVKCGIKL